MTSIEKAVEAWAQSVHDEHATPSSRREFDALIVREGDRDGVREAMAKLPAVTYACAFVHHTSVRVSRDKVREVEVLTHTPMSRRSYWDHLDRANHYMAGFLGVAP